MNVYQNKSWLIILVSIMILIGFISIGYNIEVESQENSNQKKIQRQLGEFNQLVQIEINFRKSPNNSATEQAVETVKNRLDSLDFESFEKIDEKDETVVLKGYNKWIISEEKINNVLSGKGYLRIENPDGETIINNSYVESTETEFDDYGRPRININFNKEGTEIFAEATKRYITKTLEINVDGKQIMSPKVNEIIDDGKIYVTGMKSLKEAKRIAIKIGAPPYPDEIDDVKIISSLEKDPKKEIEEWVEFISEKYYFIYPAGWEEEKKENEVILGNADQSERLIIRKPEEKWKTVKEEVAAMEDELEELNETEIDGYEAYEIKKEENNGEISKYYIINFDSEVIFVGYLAEKDLFDEKKVEIIKDTFKLNSERNMKDDKKKWIKFSSDNYQFLYPAGWKEEKKENEVILGNANQSEGLIIRKPEEKWKTVKEEVAAMEDELEELNETEFDGYEAYEIKKEENNGEIIKYYIINFDSEVIFVGYLAEKDSFDEKKVEIIKDTFELKTKKEEKAGKK